MYQASADNQSYRRGQALGFTVAELFTLLLFLVLLILASVEQHEKTMARSAQEKLDDVQKELDKKKNENIDLAKKGKHLRRYFGVPDNFGDDFNDLVPNKDSVSEWRNQLSLKKKARAADKINALLNGSVPKNGANPEGSYDPKSLPAQVKSCIDENQRLKGQVANVEKRFGGAGTVFPSCWVTSGGGAEFVFDVDLLSGPDGGRLLIHDNRVSGHDEEKAQLFRDIQFNQPLTDSDFLDETWALYNFGTKQQPECRFFVRVNDRTAPQDKSSFKELLLTVEKNFYKALAKDH